MAPALALVVVLLLGARVAPASAAPSATPREPLRTIGRVHAVTAFCKAFEAHYNGAVVPLLAADVQLGYVDYTMGRIEPDYRDRAPELRLYDDRVKLIAYLKQLFAAIPESQNEINALRESAKVAVDPQTAKSTHELAAQLQRALDRQHALAIDSLGVAHAMTDVATGTNLTWVSDPIDNATPVPMQPIPVPGGYDSETQKMPESMRDVRTILGFQKQLDRIGAAESGAAQSAEQIASNC